MIELSRCILSLIIPVAITSWGLKKKSLSYSGAICGGQRNWIQVICNGGASTFFASLCMLKCGHGEQLVDFKQNYLCSWLSIAVLGSLACANGDTWASELGSVLSKTNPVLITTFQSVPVGTNGGVSKVGLLVSAVGGLFIGAAHYAVLLLCIPQSSFEYAPCQWKLIIIGGIGGFLGSVIDSFLGATLQYSGIDESGYIVEQPGKGVLHISGNCILNNHLVNLISSAITAIALSCFSILIM